MNSPTFPNIGFLMPLNAQTPIMTSQPIGEIYIQGCTITLPLNVTVSLNDGGLLSYQWYVNTENSNSGGTPVGVNSGRYSPVISELGTLYYYCVITNNNVSSIGDKSASVISNVVSVEVKENHEKTVYLDISGREQNQPFYNLDIALKFTEQSGIYTLRIIEDQILAPRTLNTNITLQANNPSNPVEIQLLSVGRLFTVNGILTLENGITLRGLDNNTRALVYVYSGTLNMREGSKITGNTNTDISFGGGVLSDYGTINMSGGEISGNSVTNNANNGGGIYVIDYGSSSVTRIGGTAKIINNTKGSAGNETANNVFLAGDVTITSGTGTPVPVPASGMQVGVSTNNRYGVIATNAVDDYSPYFISDNNNFNLIWRNNNMLFAPITGTVVVINMYASVSGGWAGNGALRIVVNGTEIDNNVKVHTTAANNVNNNTTFNRYNLFVNSGETVQIYWVSGTNQFNNAFVAYYYDTPPSPAFSPSSWSGSNAEIFKLYNTNIPNGELLRDFTVP